MTDQATHPDANASVGHRYGVATRIFGFPGLTIRAKAYLALGGVTVLLAFLGLLFVGMLRHQVSLVETVDRQHFPRMKLFSDFFTELSRIHSNVFDLLVTAEGELDEETVSTKARPKLNDARNLLRRMSDVPASFELDAIEAGGYDYLIREMNDYVAKIAMAIDMASVDVRLARHYMVDANKSYRQVDWVLSDLEAGSEHHTAAAIFTAHARIATDSLLISVILASAFGILMLFGWAISRVLVTDLRDIAHDMTELASGNTVALRLPADRKGEIGEMVRALKVFRRNIIDIAQINRTLVEQGREIQASKERADREKQEALDKLRVLLEEQARHEIELVHAQKLESLGTLAGGVAHEINTPIQFIGNNLGFLQECFDDLLAVIKECDRLSSLEGELPPIMLRLMKAIEEADPEYLLKEIPESIAQSQRGANQISEIVQAIKEFSHPGSKEMVAIDLNQAVRNTITVAHGQCKNFAEVRADLDPVLPLVHCLPGELNQVVLNLIVNAAQAIEEMGAEEKGAITVTTRSTGNGVEITVADTGPGIPEANLKKIFEPFFTTKEPGKGTGQGLSIAHAIVTKMHGGTLSVSSKPGEGAVFTIFLPFGEESEAAA